MMRIQLVVLITSWLTDGVVALSPRAPSSRAITTTDSLASTCIEEKQPAVQPSQQQSATARPRNDGTGVFDMEDWKWCYSSNWDIASTAYKCSDIEGTVPADLRGTLFRNGPGNFQRGNKRYEHTLDGDGFIASWKFSDDCVEYRGRFVETDYFLKEQQQDAILYRNTFGTQREGGMLANALDVKLKNVANTNAVSFGDRLFALWEAGKPYELDPNTLETMPDSNDVPPFTGLGKSDCMRGVTIDNGGIMDEIVNTGRAFTAHPHEIEEGRLAAFTWAQEPITKTMKLEFSEYDSNWNVKQKIPYNVQNCPMAPHDFCWSSDYYGFFENSMSFDLTQFLMGAKGPAQVLVQNLAKPCKLHFVSRTKDGASFQVHVPDFFCIHNSARMVQDESTTLTLFSSGWDLADERYYPKEKSKVPFLGSWGGEYPNFDVIPPSTLFRTVVDKTTKQLVDHSKVIAGLNFEHPHIDPRDPTVIYGPCSNTVGLSTAPSGYCRVDTKTNTIQTWWTETRVFTEEVVVVPKRNPETNEPRDECWLLGVLHDAQENRSSLAIVDGDDIEKGPVCRIHLKHPLAYSLHGTFAPSKI
jgi:all-trans-8'-apo-beta-carotenal 15,15'-oxygenase